MSGNPSKRPYVAAGLAEARQESVPKRVQDKRLHWLLVPLTSLVSNIFKCFSVLFP